MLGKHVYYSSFYLGTEEALKSPLRTYCPPLPFCHITCLYLPWKNNCCHCHSLLNWKQGYCAFLLLVMLLVFIVAVVLIAIRCQAHVVIIEKKQ